MLRKRMEHIYELLTLLYQKQQEDNIFVFFQRRQKLAGQAGGCQAKLSAFAFYIQYRNVENPRRQCSFF